MEWSNDRKTVSIRSNQEKSQKQAIAEPESTENPLDMALEKLESMKNKLIMKVDKKTTHMKASKIITMGKKRASIQNVSKKL